MDRQLWALATSLAAVSFGCDAEEAPQLLRGTLVMNAAAVGVSHVLAGTAQGLAALAPIASDGTFLLALPLGGPFRIDLTDRTAGTTVPLADVLLDASTDVVGIRVCRVSTVIDLGPAKVLPATCRGDIDCLLAQREAWRCEAVRPDECTALWNDLTACQAALPEICNTPPGDPSCLLRCASLDADYMQRCENCVRSKESVDQACAPDVCPPNGKQVVLSRDPLPSTVGCEQVPPSAG